MGATTFHKAPIWRQEPRGIEKGYPRLGVMVEHSELPQWWSRWGETPVKIRFGALLTSKSDCWWQHYRELPHTGREKCCVRHYIWRAVPPQTMERFWPRMPNRVWRQCSMQYSTVMHCKWNSCVYTSHHSSFNTAWKHINTVTLPNLHPGVSALRLSTIRISRGPVAYLSLCHKSRFSFRELGRNMPPQDSESP